VLRAGSPTDDSNLKKQKMTEINVEVYAEDLIAEEKVLNDMGWDDLDSINYLSGTEAQLLKTLIQLHKRTRALEQQLWEVRRGNTRQG